MWLRILILCLWASIASASSVQWNASVVDAEHGEPDGYRVYYGQSSSQLTTTYDVGSAVTFQIPNEWPAGTYYFGVRAYNATGESGWATTPEGQTWVSYVKSDPPPTEPPAAATDVRIFWEAIMANENYTTWGENDPNSRLSVASDTITVTGLGNEAGNVDKNFGSNYFSGDFEHRISFGITSTSNQYTVGGIWALSDTNDWDYSQIGSDGICIYYWEDEDVLYIEKNGAYNSFGSISKSTTYYLKIVRSSGNVTAYLYSDSGYSNLLATSTSISYTQQSDYVSVAWNRYAGGSWTGYIYAIDTNPSGGGASAVPKIMLSQDHFSGGLH